MRLILAMMCSLFLLPACAQAQNEEAGKQLTITTAKGKSYDFKVELALTPDQQAYGLMNRTKLAGDSGMLFVFGSEAEQSFWMKDTLIPLDMIFIKKDGTISHIHQNAKPKDLTSISSEGPVLAVLEINGGATDSLGIQEGDVVHNVIFGNALASK